MSRCLMLIVTAGLMVAGGNASARRKLLHPRPLPARQPRPRPIRACSCPCTGACRRVRAGAVGVGHDGHLLRAQGRRGPGHDAGANGQLGQPAGIPDRRRRQAADQRLQGERPHAVAPGAPRRPHHAAAGRRYRRGRADADAAAAAAHRVAARVRRQSRRHRDGGRGGRPRRLRHGRGQHAGRGAPQGADDGAPGARGRRRLQGLRQQGRHQGPAQDAGLGSRRDHPVQLQGRPPQRRAVFYLAEGDTVVVP